MTRFARSIGYPTVSPSPVVQSSKAPAGTAVAVFPIEMLTTPDSDRRFDKWSDQGRCETDTFNEKARMIGIVLGIPVSILLGILWILTAV